MNISQEEREKMLMLLSKIKEEKKDDKDVVIALNEIENEIKNMKYGLMWEEHEEEVDKELEHSIPIFSEEKDKEILVDKKDKFNFLLEGDNLHSLKLLERTHKEKIDIIYIDPPYNTKNKDFIYDDNMIGEDDGYRHSKWLSFMQRRLEIAKDLLTDDGVIFISIDDNEQAQLKLLCDNIFGENNFVACMPRSTRKGGGSMSKYVSIDHDYVMFYAKNINVKSRMYVPFDAEYLKRYNFEDEKGKFFWDTFARNRQGSSNIYEIEFPNGEKIKKAWIYKEEKFKKLLEEGEVAFRKTKKGEYTLQIKQRLNENGQIMRSEINNFPNSKGTKSLVDLIGRDKFSYAKPYELIEYLLESQNNKDSIILDFFAGSGTTGHAVAKLNAEDEGNRTYILCTNNENNICEEVTYKRLLGIQKELPHNLKYFKTDFLEKSNEDLLYDLMEHMYEMIVLENGYSKESKKYSVILTDEDMDELEEHISEYINLEKIYMSNEVLLTSKQNNILSNYEIKYIPQYYFDNELKEMGEFW